LPLRLINRAFTPAGPDIFFAKKAAVGLVHITTFCIHYLKGKLKLGLAVVVVEIKEMVTTTVDFHFHRQNEGRGIGRYPYQWSCLV